MKIAIVSGDDVVGDEPQQLCAALAARQHEATFCVRQRGQARSTDGYRTISIPVGPHGAASASEASDVLPYVGDWAATLERVWASDQPDVVHAYGWLGGLAAQLAARRRQFPPSRPFWDWPRRRALHAVGGWRHDSERMRIEPLLARSATWVTGESTADVDALTRLRRSRARASALTCGVDVERFRSGRSGARPVPTFSALFVWLRVPCRATVLTLR